MIYNKKELKEYIKADNWYYYSHYTKWDRILFVCLRDPQYLLHKYKIYLRKEEYYSNVKTKINTIKMLFYTRKKNIIGNKLGLLIPANTFGKGLMIMHHGAIIVNPKVRVGEYCILHGNNCIGNNSKTEDVPTIGNYLDLGIGAKIIGNVQLGDNVMVGANAVVNKSFEHDCVLVGIPAKIIKKRS